MSLKWEEMQPGKEWAAYAFSGFVCYHIRLLRSGKYAITIGPHHYDAVSSIVEAAEFCEEHRKLLLDKESRTV